MTIWFLFQINVTKNKRYRLFCKLIVLCVFVTNAFSSATIESANAYFTLATDSLLYDTDVFCNYTRLGNLEVANSTSTEASDLGQALQSLCLAYREENEEARRIALEVVNRSEDHHALLYAHAAIGLAAENANQLNKASEHFILALEHAEKGGATREVGRISAAIAYIFYLLEYWDQSGEYAYRALEIGLELDRQPILALAWFRLYSLYSESEEDGHHELAKLYKFKYDSLANAIQNPNMLIESLIGKAWQFKLNDQLDSALYYYHDALAISKENKDSLSQMNILGNLLEIALTNDDLNEAGKMVGQLKPIVNVWEDHFDVLFPIYQWAYYEHRKGNHQQAYTLLDEYVRRDQIYYDEETRSDVLEYEAKYEHLKQQSEIDRQALQINKRTAQRNIAFVGFALLLAIGSLVYALFRDKQRAQLYENNQMLLQTENELISSRMKMMRAQMNPHFLFNSLNSIKHHIIQKSKDESAQYISDFSKLMRLNLQNSAEILIPLEREVAFLRQYVHMEQMRFKEPFEVQWEIDEEIDLDSYLFPPMLIQPYIENAIWHGLRYKKEKGKINIQMYSVNEDHLVCVIQDNGVGRERSAEIRASSLSLKKSMGTKITEDRIEMTNMILDADIRVHTEDLYSDQGKALGTRVTMYIPKINED